MVHKITVWQLKDSDDLHYYRFSRLSLLEKMGLKVELKNYKSVYTDVRDIPSDDNCGFLEGLYSEFQGVKPNGYKGHSLSVSDIIQVDETYYYCDSFGFKKLNLK